MKTYLQTLWKGTLIFIGLLGIDFLIAIFQLSQSGLTKTPLGIRIETEMDATSLHNMVTGTWTLLANFILFLLLWSAYQYFKVNGHRLKKR